MSDNNTYQKKKERLLERARNPYHQQGGTARTGRKLLLSTGYKKKAKKYENTKESFREQARGK